MNIPNRVCVVDGKLHIGMNKREFLRVNLRCTQEKLEGVLNGEVTGFALCRVELKGDGYTQEDGN